MTTSAEREAILTEYGQWVEQKTLDGLDLSVEAYLDEVETKEKAAQSDRLYGMVMGTSNNGAATFLAQAKDVFGIRPKEEPNELD